MHINLGILWRLMKLNFSDKKTTSVHSVVMVDPTNTLNRYIPFYTDRYILAGSSLITKDQQWQVLSFCNGQFGADCNARDELATAFYADPSTGSLADITSKYKLDYVMFAVSPTNPFDATEVPKLKQVAADQNYIIYQVMK